MVVQQASSAPGETVTSTTLEPAPATLGAPALRGAPSATLPTALRRRPVLLLVAGAAGLAGLYALGALLPFWFLASPEAGAAFFPAAGLTLSVLLLTPRSTWFLWLPVVAATEVVIDLSHDLPVDLALGFALANTAEPLVGALVLSRLLRQRPTARWRMLNFVLFLTFGFFVAPLVGAAIATATVSMWGSATSLPSMMFHWWLGDAIGVLVVATVILCHARPQRFQPSASVAETAAMVVVAVTLTILPAIEWHYPVIYVVPPAFMWAALRGGMRAVAITGVAVALAIDWATVTGRAGELLANQSPQDQLVPVQLFLAVTLVAGLVLAIEIGERRRAEASMRAAVLERERSEREVLAATEAERRTIARDTHDIVGHALNVILLQAAAARRSLSSDDRRAKELLHSLESVGRRAFRELDLALGLVDMPSDAGRGLERVPDLVELMRSTGMDVSLDVEGEPDALPTIVDWSAYRVVQEALTNIAKYAPDAEVRVTIRHTPTAVDVVVLDTGGAPPAERGGSRSGRGLVGMRERVAFLGGDLEAQPSPGGGFAVHARLPHERGSP